MTDSDTDFGPFAARLREAGMPELFVDVFGEQYGQLVAGETGLIPEDSIEPVRDLPDADDLASVAPARAEETQRTVVIKLNGGLGTGMGLDRAKSLLEVRDGLTFLDIMALQAEHDGVPLVLMNSFATDADSAAALASYPRVAPSIPLSFVQHQAPKVRQADLRPVEHPADRRLEWFPPGHGDLYTALLTSGVLDDLIAAGYRYAFVSNGDNLGAVLDPTILGHFVDSGSPFMMEVADRTDSDRKGGHVARTKSGGLVLRDSAQCPAGDREAFADIERHRYFNTNNLWLDLVDLRALLRERGGRLGLPLIRNAKTVDPRDPSSTPVFQLETAMGSALSVIDGARVVRVPRRRFAPVKHTSDLVTIRSDAFELDDGYRLVPAPGRGAAPPNVVLDPHHFGFASDLDERFPHGVPSLVCCDSLQVVGDVAFGRDVVLEGDVVIRNAGEERVVIPDGATISGETEL
ncbi:MAG: UTP--glucose-1-phosphate uridylyltransferase [Anaerolineae bacterium]